MAAERLVEDMPFPTASPRTRPGACNASRTVELPNERVLSLVSYVPALARLATRRASPADAWHRS